MNNHSSLPVIADFREKFSGIPRLLSRGGAEVRLTTLKTGDYLINDKLLIERKSAEDFIRSLIADRLFSQCARLVKSGYQPFLLLEGNPYKTSHQIVDQAVKGALLSVIASWQIPVIYSKDPEDSARQIIMLLNQVIPHGRLLTSYGHKPKKINTHRLQFLQGLPQTGPVRAKRLYDYFGSIEAVVKASESELQQVEGIGKKAAKKIREFVSCNPLLNHPFKTKPASREEG